MNVKIVVAVIIAGLLLTACAKINHESALDTNTVTDLPPDVKEGEELYCFCDDEEDAKDIANDYNIEYIRFCDGIATFHAQGDLKKIIKEGKEAGFKELSLNILKELK